mmetsp:Transcript_21513/g.21847  ORF Transcript_21513/g.21847 Transcript_21513/m.21847 type:complete len:105 (-) Transcript_21513:149-463(-)
MVRKHTKERKCHPEVKRLCDLAKGAYEHSCHKTNNPSHCSGSVINSYLQTFGPGYGTGLNHKIRGLFDAGHFHSFFPKIGLIIESFANEYAETAQIRILNIQVL